MFERVDRAFLTTESGGAELAARRTWTGGSRIVRSPGDLTVEATDGEGARTVALLLLSSVA